MFKHFLFLIIFLLTFANLSYSEKDVKDFADPTLLAAKEKTFQNLLTTLNKKIVVLLTQYKADPLIEKFTFQVIQPSGDSSSGTSLLGPSIEAKLSSRLSKSYFDAKSPVTFNLGVLADLNETNKTFHGEVSAGGKGNALAFIRTNFSKIESEICLNGGVAKLSPKLAILAKSLCKETKTLMKVSDIKTLGDSFNRVLADFVREYLTANKVTAKITLVPSGKEKAGIKREFKNSNVLLVEGLGTGNEIWDTFIFEYGVTPAFSSPQGKTFDRFIYKLSFANPTPKTNPQDDWVIKALSHSFQLDSGSFQTKVEMGGIFQGVFKFPENRKEIYDMVEELATKGSLFGGMDAEKEMKSLYQEFIDVIVNGKFDTRALIEYLGVFLN
jgi:hypothetical protein